MTIVLSLQKYNLNPIPDLDFIHLISIYFLQMFASNWRSYGLASAPNVGENAVHASASPFEALAERMNWLGKDPSQDSFGQLVLKAIGSSTLKEWAVDPTIIYGKIPIKKSLFDSVEDTDTAWCLCLLGMMKAQLRGSA